jgi:biopolymer transport protein ExbD
MATWLEEVAAEEGDEGPALRPRRVRQDTELDMTPMIDCTFLLLIFFTVSATLEPSSAPDLPVARKGKGVDDDMCVIVTIAAADDQGRGVVYLGDGTQGEPTTGTPEAIRAAVRAELEQGVRDGKKVLLIKAEGRVAEREVLNVARASTELEGDPVPVAVAVKESK